ncbi:MAG: ABC transporter ATP-binding protein [Halanaerobiales bacterium]|nr:ABC transporter ATP-binding protein [Halanaerobiales bacterium]
MGRDTNIIMIDKIKVAYGEKIILEDLSLSIKKGKMVSIIGPNGSGKSTIIKAISKNTKIKKGKISFEGKNISKIKSKEYAREIAVLSQHYVCPTDISVRELVSYGRYAYTNWMSGGTKEDTEIIDWALNRTGVKEYENRKMSTLSGGEKQRVWIAMALAQKPKVLLLDEPTTYLDMCHQLELLELIKSLNINDQLTVVMVLHDINQAIRYSDEIIVINNGQVVAEGNVDSVIDHEILKSVFRINATEVDHHELERSIYYAKSVV